MQQERNFAILIDADNISTKYVKNVLDEISNYGVITYKRVYGDLTIKENKNWEKVLLDNALTPVQQFSYTTGKSSTDSAMIIDAMDILYSGNVDGFCIVSSDSDFTRLVTRLREAGKEVIGMGEQKTPKPFVKACSRFKYLDLIMAAEKSNSSDASVDNVSSEVRVKQNIKSQSVDSNDLSEAESVKNQIVPKKDILQDIRRIFNETEVGSKGLNIGELGQRLIKNYPDFDVRNYGYNRLSALLNSFECFETKESYVFMTKTKKTNIPKPKTVENAIVEYLKKEDKGDGVNILDVKRYLEDRFQEFDIADFGYSKFSTFLKDFPILKVHLTGKSNGVMNVELRNKVYHEKPYTNYK